MLCVIVFVGDDGVLCEVLVMMFGEWYVLFGMVMCECDDYKYVFMM